MIDLNLLPLKHLISDLYKAASGALKKKIAVYNNELKVAD